VKLQILIDCLDAVLLSCATIYPGDTDKYKAIQRSFAAVGLGSSDITLTGTLPSNETWTGFVPIIGDITVPSGKTLTIQAGQ